MKKWLLSKSLLVATCLLLLFYAVSDVAAQSQPQKNPELIRVATYDIASLSYVTYGFIQKFIENNYKTTRLRVIPIGSDMPRMQVARSKQVDFATQGTDIFFAAEGLDKYSTRDWGPQSVRVAWAPDCVGTVVATRGNSGIKTVADLKGKRFPWIPGSIFNVYHEEILAFANLTWEDVKKVQVPGYGGMLKALIDGAIDVAMPQSTSPQMYELASSIGGVRYIPLPAEDKEGWKRIQKINPAHYPKKVTYGAGISKGESVDGIGHPYPVPCGYDFLGDNITYFMTKVMHEAYPVISKEHEVTKLTHSLESTLNTFLNAKGMVFYPASVRYFKEIRVWKPEWDKLIEKRIQRQNALKKLWNETVAEADSKGIKDSDFSNFWLKKRETLKEELL